MVKIKPLDKSRDKWSSRASIAGEEYATGIDAADWVTAAKSDQAEKNYSQAMMSVLEKKRRQSGVGKVSNEVWKSAAKDKGKTRYVAEVGTDRAKAKWENKFKPYYNIIAGHTFTVPRGPRGTETNWERSKELGKKLYEQKIKGTS